MSTAVSRAKHAALLLWAISVAQRARQDDVRILWINHDVTNTSCFLKPHQFPGLARVRRFVDALAHRDVTANPGFAGAGPDYIWIRWRDGQRADRGDGLTIEDRFPMHSAVSRFPNTARRRAD